MDKSDQLIQSLSYFPSAKWLNRYFDWVKKLLTDLDITATDKRLSLTLNKNGSMPVNLGQRYVMRPAWDGYAGFIVPIHFDTEMVEGFESFLFSNRGINDAKFMEVPMPEDKPLPESVYNACLEECDNILQHCERSGFRKYHVPLLYDFIMEPAVRSEIMDAVRFQPGIV